MSTHRIKLTEAKKRRIAAKQGYLCASCKNVLPSTWNLDHLVPLHLGGSNSLSNFQVLCPNCHADKSQRELIVIGEEKRAQSTQSSRYFDPLSVDFIGTESIGDFFDKFRFAPPSWS